MGCGSHLINAFTVRNINRSIVERFHYLVDQNSHVYCREQSDGKGGLYSQYICSLHYKHPFVLKIKDMGWTPIRHQNRVYPEGDFDHEIFISTYVKNHHNIGTSYCRSRGYTRARLRINGSLDIITNINNFLANKLNIGVKNIQTHHNKERTKYIQYTSKTEIPIILTYIKAYDSIEKFRAFKLGFKKMSR
ncbi:hypothetical protein [Priestia aryabhattai]